MIVIAVPVGHFAQQHAVLRIIEVEFLLGTFDFEHIDRLLAVAQQLIHVVHMPSGIIAGFVGSTHRPGQLGIGDILLGHVPFAGGIEPCLHDRARAAEIGDHIPALVFPFDMACSGEHLPESGLHGGRYLYRFTVVVTTRHHTQRHESHYQYHEFLHTIPNLRLIPGLN